MISHAFVKQEIGGEKEQRRQQHGIAHLFSGGGTNKYPIPDKGHEGDNGNHDHPEEIRFGIGDHLRVIGE